MNKILLFVNKNTFESVMNSNINKVIICENTILFKIIERIFDKINNADWNPHMEVAININETELPIIKKFLTEYTIFHYTMEDIVMSKYIYVLHSCGYDQNRKTLFRVSKVSNLKFKYVNYNEPDRAYTLDYNDDPNESLDIESSNVLLISINIQDIIIYLNDIKVDMKNVKGLKLINE